MTGMSLWSTVRRMRIPSISKSTDSAENLRYYILEHPELVIQIKPLKLSRTAIDKCKNQGVKNDAELISYNIPELFE